MKPTRREKQIFWDYNFETIDLKNPKVMTWFLSRKIKFGDFSRITKKDLKKYLPKLEISHSFKQLLRNYLKAGK
ncbi:MAG: hypothetical protein Q7S57_04600 [bacterium]|nr:hypothetical protein [bacterium]